MNIVQFLILLLIIACTSCDRSENLDKITITDLKSRFSKPPREAGVRCWWWWLNSNVTKASITKDLEAMHDKGFSGAMIFDAGTELGWGPDKPVPDGPMFSSPEWTELYLHALREAQRLDLELGLSIQSGWNLGGPTVPPDDAAKQVTWTEFQIDGPGYKEQKIPIPDHNYEYYRDICLLAYPTKENKERQPISFLSAKSGARELGGSAPDCRFLLNDHPSIKGEEDTKLNEIVDISTTNDIPAAYRNTPIRHLLEYHNLNKPFDKLKNAGWKKEMAEDHFVKLAPESEIGNEIDFVLMETERLRKLYPTVCIVPLLYKVENNRLYPVNENQR